MKVPENKPIRLGTPSTPIDEISKLLRSMPQGTEYRATRYDTEDQHVLSVYNDGKTYDIRIPKKKFVQKWGWL